MRRIEKIEITSEKLNIGHICEPEVNNIASDYIVNHWGTLVKGAVSFGADPLKAEDLVQDLVLKILADESEGNGYDSSKGKSSDCITVNEMVWRKLKLYSKNKKYHRCTSKSSGDGDYVEIPACSDFDDDSESLNSAQYAYATAGNEEYSLDNIDTLMSIRADIEKIMFGPYMLRNILRDLDYFINNLNSIDLKGILAGFRIRKSEYADSLRNVLMFHASQPELVESIIKEFS